MSILNYVGSPTLNKFHKSNAFVKGIKGPIGSGKSVGCCFELFMRAWEQPPGTDGVRRRRSLIVRNTQPQLETTTLKTWLDWFPEDTFGRLRKKPPFEHQIRIRADDCPLEWEVLFLALDKPEDVNKLLSFESSDVWFNEAREINKAILDGATGRVGRYPSFKQKPAHLTREQYRRNIGIIMDTNPPDDSHWWYKFAEENAWFSKEYKELIEKKLGVKVNGPEDVPDAFRFDFFSQPSGVSPEAENLQNLDFGYYEKAAAGKTEEWKNVYIHGKYGIIATGKPVYGDNYNDDLHSTDDEISVMPNSPVYIGLDFWLNPAAVFAQRDARGRWVVLRELCAEDMELNTFAQLLRGEIELYFPNNPIIMYGDPSGSTRDQQGATAFMIFRKHGLQIDPAPTNAFEGRKQSVLTPLLRMVEGKPGLVISRKLCPILRRGFNGNYKFRRLKVSSDEARHSLEPEKNRFSHVHDALQYCLCGGGEYQRALHGEAMHHEQSPYIVQKKWNTFDQGGAWRTQRSRGSRIL